MVGEVRLELTRRYRHQLLRLARLPFRHSPLNIMGGSARFVHPPTAARSARSWIKERINHGAATLLRSGSGEPGSKRANHATPLC